MSSRTLVLSRSALHPGGGQVSDAATLTHAHGAVGFYDQSHLNRLFKRAYGITPGAYPALKPGH